MSFDPDKKIIPIGVSDFKEFFDYNYYYIDKTILIKNILDTRSKVCLITRPRRFGKTLNISMLKYFFENTKNQNQDQDNRANYNIKCNTFKKNFFIRMS